MSLVQNKGAGLSVSDGGSGGAGPPGPPGPPGPAGASLINVQKITASGNYTPAANVTAIYAVLTGGGGGGARSANTPGSVGGGGGAGATAEFFASVTPLVPLPVVIGAAGAKGPAPNTNGGDGGNSTFLGRVAGGGKGGNITADPTQPPIGLAGGLTGVAGNMTRRGGAGGVATGLASDLLLGGTPGDSGVQLSSNVNGTGGYGGPSRWGGGGFGSMLATGFIGVPPYFATAGSAFGSGGGGANFAFDAAPGAAGVLVVYEYGTGGGGGTDLFEFLDRGDFSVNRGSVDNAWSATPVIKTQPGVNAAGGYNGGGTGNKAILGVDVADGALISTLATLAYTWRPLVPYVTTPFQPYLNLVVELGAPAPAGFKILVIDPAAVPALNVCTTINNGDGTFTTTFNAAANFVQVVLDVPGYPPGVPLPAVNLNPVGSWLNRSYDLAAIQAAYPLAAFRRASSLDGGMPIATITPALMVVGGDSANNRVQAWEITNILWNGTQV